MPWERYKKDVHELLDMRLRAYSANVLWRAYGPTHFGGPTGTFTGMHPCHDNAVSPEAVCMHGLPSVPAPLCQPFLLAGGYLRVWTRAPMVAGSLTPCQACCRALSLRL